MIPMTLKFQSINNKIKEFHDDPIYTQKFGISLKCDQQERKNYVWIMSDNNPRFYVHMVKKNDISEVLGKFIPKKKLNIREMYSLILSVVFVSLIRPLLSGKTTKLRLAELPRTEIMMIMLDAMTYARLEGDLVKEQLLFCRMIDIMRDPDMIQHVSDRTLRYREEDIYDRFIEQK